MLKTREDYRSIIDEETIGKRFFSKIDDEELFNQYKERMIESMVEALMTRYIPIQLPDDMSGLSPKEPDGKAYAYFVLPTTDDGLKKEMSDVIRFTNDMIQTRHRFWMFPEGYDMIRKKYPLSQNERALMSIKAKVAVDKMVEKRIGKKQ